MRDRGGGRIGGFNDDVPQQSSAVGCWKIGEACQWLHVDRWPRRKIIITGMPDFVDTTVGGFGEIKPTITTEDYGYGIIEWQYSNNNGSTWSTIQADGRHAVDAQYGWLTLTDQTRNTGSTANYAITNPPPIERASVNGGYPDDGRLYRVVVTCGLRVVRSDYWEVDSNGVGSWKGRCPVWNDRVLVTFTSGPCVNPETISCTGPQAEFTATVGENMEIHVEAEARGEEHNQEYDIAYSWRVSPNGTSNWSVLSAFNSSGTPNGSGANTNLLKFNNAVTGTTYLQAVATFTYSDATSDPPHVIPLTKRPLVNGYSDVLKVIVVSQT